MARTVVGVQPVRELVGVHGARVERLLLAAGASPRLLALARFATDRGITVESVAPATLDRLARGVSHQGVVAVGPDLANAPLDTLVTTEAAIVVLDGITDPHNFGATVRSAVALGSGALVFGEHRAAPLSAATFRASAGAIEHAQLCRVGSLRAALGRLGELGVLTVALDAQANEVLAELDLRGPVAVVVGAEDRGVGRGVRRVCAAQARIAMRGPLGSLNASVATACALYEVARQRGTG